MSVWPSPHFTIVLTRNLSTYRLSKNLPRYVPMEWMANYVYKNIPLLEFKKIDDPTLVLPPHPELIPRGRRGARGLPGPRGPGGVCARQLGYAMPLKEFVDVEKLLTKVSSPGIKQNPISYRAACHISCQRAVNI